MTAPASLEDAAVEGRVVAWFAVTEPDRPAVVSERHTLTFAELDGRANRLVRALRARGLTAGDSIALIAPNRAEWVETFAAAQRSGLRMTPINFHLGPDEAEYIIRDCGARAVVLDGRLARPRARRDRRRGPARDRCGRRRARGLGRLRGRARGRVTRSDRGPRARLDHALHVGHHRPAEGRLPAAGGPRDRARPQRASPGTSPAWCTSSPDPCTTRPRCCCR